MLWNRNPRSQARADFITLYKGEDLHPKVAEVFDWAETYLWSQFRSSSEAKKKTILAGGALRSYFTGTTVRDFDLYFRSQKDYEFVIGQIPTSFMLVPQISERSVTYRRSIQRDGQLEVQVLNLIKDKFVASPEAVIENYDFTVCMCALTEDTIVYHPQYFMDLAMKSLRVYSPDSATSTLYRMQKYIQMGYTIDQENLHKLLEAVQERETLPNIYKPEDQKLDTEVLSTLYGSS